MYYLGSGPADGHAGLLLGATVDAELTDQHRGAPAPVLLQWLLPSTSTKLCLQLLTLAPVSAVPCCCLLRNMEREEKVKLWTCPGRLDSVDTV